MADVPFQQIPSNLRVPLFYAEVNNSQANTAPENLRALLIGSKMAAGSAAPNVVQILQGVPAAKSQYGAGSVLAGMAAAYRQNDAFGEVWCLPVADTGGTAAAGAIAFAGPATAAGTLSLYVAGELVAVPVTSGMTAVQLATAVAAAVAANVDLPVTAAVDGTTTSKVDFTAKNLGQTGNDIDIRLNFGGTAKGEATPAGITPTITAMAGGATNPSLTTALANLQDMPFEFIACAFNDAASMAAITAFLNDSTGRWSWQYGLYGHAIYAYRATYAGLTTFGVTLNDQHSSALGVYDTPKPTWKTAARVTADVAISVRADPAQPIRNVSLTGELAPPLASRFSLSQRNSLLYDGISTFNVDQGGNVNLEKLITTYQVNSFGSPDNSYLDAETLFTTAAVLRRLKAVVTSKYGRCKLAADGTNLQPGSGVVTPNIIRADLIAEYRLMEQELGWVQRSDVFAEGLIVQQNSVNPNRVDVLWPGVLIDRLDIFALLDQFRLS